MKPNVQVLLSTYNGERFLETQIESLFEQKDINLSILIRDDGSTDNTINILKKYQNHNNIEVIFAENVGVIDSFFELIQQANLENDYFAFCDQDDFWRNYKIFNAIEKIEEIPEKDSAILYASSLELVDDKLNPIGYSSYRNIKTSFENALVENVVTGCTAVINKQALKLIKEKKPEFCLMHDWWMYLVISAFGIIIYDEKSSIKYRQHGNNVVGMKNSFFTKMIDKINRFMKRTDRDLLIKQAEEFSKLYSQNDYGIYKGELSRFIEHRNNFLQSMKYSIKMKVYRQNFVDNIFLRLLVFFRLI
ncbi:glycosyltransferase family 2 protein [Aerococcus urinaeequi]|uniref:glycosyltransferase family 2 protein n=1 Tax=Aerococcus urinaeequi TaxID=51665 RepID=UPI003D6C4442